MSDPADQGRAGRGQMSWREDQPGTGGSPISYFSLTAGGALLALKLRDRFGGTAHLPRCHSLGCQRCDPFDSISEAMPKSFQAGETVVCVMAAGIVFRVLAPHLKTKQEDPAVIVLDEEGRHIIPLLGGHAAGANLLARQIAGFLGGRAAITTASDVLGLTAPDEVARLLVAEIDDPVMLREITALLIGGKRICVESPGDPGIEGYEWVVPGSSTAGFDGRLLISYKTAEPEADPGRSDQSQPARATAAANGSGGGAGGARPAAAIPTARLIPRCLSAGVGCRRDTAAEAIIAAIKSVCAAAGLDMRAIAFLASIEAKRDEPGLLQAAARLRAGLVFFRPDELKRMNRPGSRFVAEKVGSPAVSEPAALLAAGPGATLLAPKTAAGPVTVALAAPAVRAGSRQDQLAGRVLVVGTGAGTAPLLTEEARRAIAAADVVLGYRTYIDQLRELFPHKNYVSGSMGAEIERCRQAIEMAASGQTVALVSSGDPGVYGMAGPLLELAGDTPVTVIPGVTAAQFAAARLGAPLMCDYVTLSLSDLLTPRAEVIRRLRAAAASDMVICLYNPASRKRRPLFEEACAILLEHRPAETPVGWVFSAGGRDEKTGLDKLKNINKFDVDMRTIIIIGNSRTEVIGGKMVTRRGYESKLAAAGSDPEFEHEPNA